MLAHSDSNRVPQRRACETEAIHLVGSIQPHGVLLAFDRRSEALAYWAGDCERLFGGAAGAGVPASDLFGRPLESLLGGRLLAAGQEPVHVGTVELPGGQAIDVSAHRSGRLVIVELEPTSAPDGAVEVLDRVRAINDLLGTMPTLTAACEAAAAQVRAISGFDRVMIYRFAADCSGSVIAEARGPRRTSFLGHRFPASDIPAQARALYARNLLRVIADVGADQAPLHPRSTAPTIDMSNCLLRSVSPVHLQDLKNMGVGASMSISIVIDGKLWGLIACHHRQPRLVPAVPRLLCRHVGTALAAAIRSLAVAEKAQTWAVHAAALEEALSALRSASDSERELRSSADRLLDLIECSGVALVARRASVAVAGSVPAERHLAMLAQLAEAALGDSQTFSTDRLADAYPSAEAFAADASGLLAVRIEGWRPLTILWLRAEQVEEVRWAGNPKSKEADRDGIVALTPRRSFATWCETVRGRSRPWTPEELKTAESFASRATFILQRQRLERLYAKLEEANARLNALATSDPLTGLPNRRQFDERLEAEWKRSLRSGSPLALVAIDVDNFKKYNDLFGHPAGDECLRSIADVLAEARRSGDIAARVGGEEFALLLPTTDPTAAAKVAERVRLAVERLGLEHPQNLTGVATISLGVAAGPATDGGSVERFRKCADAALYQAKSDGRNRVRLAGAAR